MTKLVMCNIILIFFVQIPIAGSGNIIKLYPGINEVFIKINNISDETMNSLQLEINENDLPNGMSFIPGNQKLNVLTKTYSENCLRF